MLVLFPPYRTPPDSGAALGNQPRRQVRSTTRPTGLISRMMSCLTAMFTAGWVGACTGPPSTAPEIPTVWIRGDVERVVYSGESATISDASIDAEGRLGYDGHSYAHVGGWDGFLLSTYGEPGQEEWTSTVFVAGDVDADGLVEYGTKSYGLGDADEILVTSDGRGALYVPPGLSSPFQRGLTCGDVNGDGIDDLCTDAYVDFGPVDGVLDYDHPGIIGGQDRGGRIADADADGTFEYYIFEGEGANAASVRTLDGSWSFTPEDGYLYAELVPQNPYFSTGSFIFYGQEHGEPKGWMLTPEHLAQGLPPETIGASELRWERVVGDFRGDGTLQSIEKRENHLVAQELDGTQIARVEIDYDFLPLEPSDYLDFAYSLAVGDHDGDGVDDLVVTSQLWDYRSSAYVHVFFAPLADL